MKLVPGIKDLINELKEEEVAAQDAGQTGMYSGLCLARVKLEALLEECGHDRPASIAAEIAVPATQI